MATHFYQSTPNFDQDVLFCLEDYGLKLIKTGRTFYTIMTETLADIVEGTYGKDPDIAKLKKSLNPSTMIFVRKSLVAMNTDQSGTHLRMEFSYFLTLNFLGQMPQEKRDEFFGRDGSNDQRGNPNITGRTITNADLALLGKSDGN